MPLTINDVKSNKILETELTVGVEHRQDNIEKDNKIDNEIEHDIQEQDGFRDKDNDECKGGK